MIEKSIARSEELAATISRKRSIELAGVGPVTAYTKQSRATWRANILEDKGEDEDDDTILDYEFLASLPPDPDLNYTVLIALFRAQ